jgi:hypothetical protein
MESAFAGPAKIAARMGGFDVRRIAEADPEEFAALCATPPAVHRFPGSMAGRIQAVARELLGVGLGDPADVEPAHARGDLGRSRERRLHRDLLVQEHPDQERERVGVEQAVRVGVAGQPEGHRAIVPERRAPRISPAAGATRPLTREPGGRTVEGHEGVPPCVAG